MEEVPLPLSTVVRAGLQCAQETEVSVVAQADVVTTGSSLPLCGEPRDVIPACKEMETGHEGGSPFESVGEGDNLHFTLDVSDGPLPDNPYQPAALTPTSLLPVQEPTSTASLPSHSALITSCGAPIEEDPTKDYNSLVPTTVQQSCSFSHSYVQQEMTSSGISVTVEGQDLWEEFYKRGTEMIVNRAGR